jgi:hypothetical protein
LARYVTGILRSQTGSHATQTTSRRFGALAARNILHLQARLIAIEHDINQQDEAARKSVDLEAKQSSRRWETLIKHASDATRPEKQRVEKLDQLKLLLREYCECDVYSTRPEVDQLRRDVALAVASCAIESTRQSAAEDIPELLEWNCLRKERRQAYASH